MRSLLLLIAGLIAVTLLAVAVNAQPVNSNVIRRVARIQFTHDHSGETAVHQGTAFTIEVQDSQYLVTAAHVIHGSTGETALDAITETGRHRISGTPIFPPNRGVDIAALELKQDLTVRLPLEPTMDGISLSQQTYFLGYPFGLETRDARGFVAPFIKSGIISAMDSSNPAERVLYIDAHNNLGFSGGPIVFWHAPTWAFRVAGVVSGYRTGEQPVYRSVPQQDGSVIKVPVPDVSARENPGILVGYSIEHIVEAISAHRAKAGC
jgi:hypothetical protein